MMEAAGPKPATKCAAAIYWEALEAFVAHHERLGSRQRSPEWFAAKKTGTTIGGSQVATAMGHNPYDRPEALVGELLGFGPRFAGNPACWWGTFFEPVLTRVAELDLGTRVIGANIWVNGVHPGHANSPDGYAVVVVERVPGPVCPAAAWRLWTTDRPEPAAPFHIPVVIEMKNPASRLPKGTIPRQYRPQLQSGLATSPPAAGGLFIDGVVRKCSLDDLGASAAYDTDYHYKDRDPDRWLGAFAWGVSAIYAPRTTPGAPLLPDSPVSDAWRLSATGGKPVPPVAAGDPPPPPVDFGRAGAHVFNTVLHHLDTTGFRSRSTNPTFGDGRGGPLEDTAGLATIQEGFVTTMGADWYLLGFIPWKYMEVVYGYVDRELDTIEYMFDCVDETHRVARAIRAAADPPAAFRAYSEQQALARSARSHSARRRPDTQGGESEKRVLDEITAMLGGV